MIGFNLSSALICLTDRCVIPVERVMEIREYLEEEVGIVGGETVASGVEQCEHDVTAETKSLLSSHNEVLKNQ